MRMKLLSLKRFHLRPKMPLMGRRSPSMRQTERLYYFSISWFSIHPICTISSDIFCYFQATKKPPLILLKKNNTNNKSSQLEEENVKDLSLDTSKPITKKKKSKSSAPSRSKKINTIKVNKLKTSAEKAITVDLEPNENVAFEHAESDNSSLYAEGLKVKWFRQPLSLPCFYSFMY